MLISVFLREIGSEESQGAGLRFGVLEVKESREGKGSGSETTEREGGGGGGGE